ncbi:MAG: hypothetical protein S4CHLAM7_06300 [Chlamydiae bacterium]|nr:hypothetical protein [Chlamydiota bacterium]
MNLQVLEKIFQRSCLTLSKKKLGLVFLTLSLCGVMAVFSRALSMESSRWVALSLSFLPFFASTNLLFALGILSVKMYSASNRGEELSIQQAIAKTWKPIVSIAYITLPLFLAYVVAWLVLGIFFLLKMIPGIGDLIGVFLSLGPFILILSSLVLACINVVALFFVTPALAFREQVDLALWKEVGARFKKNVLLNLFFLGISSIPLLLVLSILIGAAYLTKVTFFTATTPLLVGLSWFFMMLPFNAVLTPFVSFFFNFSAEAYDYLNSTIPKEALVKKTLTSV